MTLEAAIESLRVWASRALNEAVQADTREDLLSWQAQATVLLSLANFLADQGARLGAVQLWTRVVTDREKSIAAWLAQQGGPEAAQYAGEVAGYDLALTVLKDVSGRVWPRIEPHVG